MTLLWLAFALLLLPAAWLLMLPLRRAARVEAALRQVEENDDAEAQNVAIYQRRVASLEAAKSRGDIDAARFDEDLRELQRSLLDDTAHLKRSPLKPAGAGKVAVPLVLVAVLVASVVWYRLEGAEGDLVLYQAIEQVRQDPAGSPAKLVASLEAQAEAQPDNPQVWRTLYPLYRDAGRIEQAHATILRLIELDGRKPWWLAEQAQLEYFMSGREITPAIQALVDEVLAANPNEPTVMGMLGIDAFEAGDFEGAIDNWRRALATDLPPGVAEAMRQGIDVAQRRLAAQQEPQAASGGATVAVTLSLATGLGEGFGPQTTVFLVARDSAGQLPPLAIQQLRLADLPATVTLDEGDAMSPMTSLKNVDEVRLVARVSPSGQARAQSGDLVGELTGVAVGGADEDPVALTIDRVVE
ncbi:c-type cytochrome biogenesis protein CcmI [Halomonas sp. V046]|uniref:c-type cytochrome biogenesis protein CcmI n=1 Tax=Halomonas sp. V046 TaxID=3459611 RepID=UPI004044BFC6